MTASEDEKVDKASSFVDQKKGSKRCHLHVSARADNRAGVARIFRSSSNVRQIADGKSAKKARRSNLRDRKTHVVATPLNASGKVVAGKGRRRGAVYLRRKATASKPSSKNLAKKLGFRKSKKEPSERLSDKLRLATATEVKREVGVCCSEDTSAQSFSTDGVARSARSTGSTSQPEKSYTEIDTPTSGSHSTNTKPSEVSPCVQCLRGAGFKPTASSSLSQCSEMKADSTESSLKGQTSDDGELTDAAPPCVKCQGIDSKPTPNRTTNQANDVETEIAGSCDSKCAKCPSIDLKATTSGTPNQASDVKTETVGRLESQLGGCVKPQSSEGCVKDDSAELKTPAVGTPAKDLCVKPTTTSSELQEQQPSGTGLQTGQPCSCSQLGVKITSNSNSTDTKLTGAPSTLEMEANDCDHRHPASLVMESEISEGNVLASDEAETMSEQVSDVVERPTKVGSKASNRTVNGQAAKARAKNQTARAARSRSQSQKRNASKTTSRDRTENREGSSTRISKKNCTLMSWNPFKKLTRALSMSSKSNASRCTCDLGPESTENRNEKKSTKPTSSIPQQTSIQKPTSLSSMCTPCEQSSKTSSHQTTADTKLSGKPHHQQMTQMPCVKPSMSMDTTTTPALSTQLKSKSSYATKDTCRLCQQEALYEKAKLAMSKSPTAIDDSKHCPSDIPKCWKLSSRDKRDSSTCKKIAVDKSDSQEINKQHSPTMHKCWERKISKRDSSQKKCTPISKSVQDLPEKKKESSPASPGCKIRCALGKPFSTSAKDQLAEDSRERNIPPSSQSNCRPHCQVSASKTEINDKPMQQYTEKSDPSTSSEPKCVIHGSRSRPVTKASIDVSDVQTFTEEMRKKCYHKKSLSPASQNDQNGPKKCWSHGSSGKLESTPVKNETMSPENSGPPSQSKCVPKCTRHSTTDETISTPSTNRPITPQASHAKCKVHTMKDEPSSTTPTLQMCQPAPKCWVHGPKDEPVLTSSVGKPISTSPKTPKKCEASRELAEKHISPMLEKCKPLPKCWVFGKKDVPISSSTDGPISTSPKAQKKCEISKGITEKHISPSLPKCEPLPKCWVFGKKGEPVTSSADKPISTSPRAQKKCEALRGISEKNISPTLEKCNPSPKCWEFGTKDEPVSTSSADRPVSTSSADRPTSTSPGTQKRCPVKGGLAEKHSSPMLEKCKPLPKCWVFGTKDGPVATSSADRPTTSPGTQKKCPVKGGLAEKQLSPILEKCKPLPKCWVFGTKDKPVATSSTDRPTSISPGTQKKCPVKGGLAEKQLSPMLEKCKPLPKCWVFGTKDRPVSTPSADRPSSSPETQKKCPVKGGLSEKQLSPMLKKCKPLPKCWVFGTKDRPVSTPTSTSPGTQKKCPVKRELAEEHLSPVLQQCKPLPKCWIFGQKDKLGLTSSEGKPILTSPKAPKNCRALPALEKCKPLPKCWVFGTRDKSVSTTLVDEPDTMSSKAPKKCRSVTGSTEKHTTPSLQKCKPLPKCWVFGTTEEPPQTSSVDQSTSTSSKSGEKCRTAGRLSEKHVPSTLQKCQSSPKCWIYGTKNEPVSTSSAERPTSTSSKSQKKCKAGGGLLEKDVPSTLQKCHPLPKCLVRDKVNEPVSTQNGPVLPASKECAISKCRPENLMKNRAPSKLQKIEHQCRPSPKCWKVEKPILASASSSKMDEYSSSTAKSVSPDNICAKTSPTISSSRSVSSTSGDKWTGLCRPSCSRNVSAAESKSAQSTISPSTDQKKPDKTCSPICKLASGQPSPTPVSSSRTTEMDSPVKGMREPCCPQQLSTPQQTTTSKSTCAGTTHPSSSSELTTKPKSRISDVSTCDGRCKLPTTHEEIASPCAKKSTSGRTSASDMCDKPCNLQSTMVRKSITKTTSCESQPSCSPLPRLCKEIGPSPTAAPSTSSSNLCPPTCSTQFHKGQHHQHYSTAIPSFQRTTSKPNESAPTCSDEKTMGSSTALNDMCHPCESQNHPNKSTPAAQNQIHPDDSRSKPRLEATSPECEACSRLRATPAPKCADCQKKATLTIGANSAVRGGQSCFPCRTESAVLHQTELENTRQGINNMINEGYMVHPDSTKTINQDAANKLSPFVDCMYKGTEQKSSRPVDYEPGSCCGSASGSLDENNGCPHLQCSIPTTTAAPKKDDETESESTDFTSELVSEPLAGEETTTELSGEEGSSDSVLYTSTSCPDGYNSESDEKDKPSVAGSQPEKQSSASRGGLEKKALKPAPRGLRKRMVADVTDQARTEGRKKRTVSKRDESDKQVLYRSNRSSEYRQKAKKLVCGRRKYSSTDSEERTLRGRIKYRSQPQIPVTLTHSVHLRRRHTDKSRERMLKELNKKKKHETRFQ